MLVDNPILNSPFEEPARYWAYEEGQPVLKEGRRPAGYYLKPYTRQLLELSRAGAQTLLLPAGSRRAATQGGGHHR